MGQIEKIIERHYKEMATTVYNDGHFYLSHSGEKKLTEIFISAIHDNFFELLDNVINLLTNINDPKLSEDHRKAILSPSKDYYCELSIFNDNKLALFSVLEKYSDNRDNCIEQLKKRLNRAIPVSRIAELVYYKMCHRYYNKGLESAFRGVVHGVTLNSNSISDVFNKETASNIQRLTASIAREQAEKAYSDIYGNPDLLKEYRLNKKSYFDDLRNQSAVLMAYTQSNEKSSPIKKRYKSLKDYVEKYEIKLQDQIESGQFVSLNACMIMYSKKYKKTIDKQAYANVFKNMISPLAGFNYDSIKDKYKVHHYFILKTLCNDLNKIVHYFREQGKAKDYNDILPDDSRFKYINSLQDFDVVGLIIKVYIQLLIARTRYAKIATYNGNDIYKNEEAVFILKNARSRR